MINKDKIIAITYDYGIKNNQIEDSNSINTNNLAMVFYSFKKHKTGYTEKLFKTLNSQVGSRNITLQKSSLKDLIFIINDNKLSIIDGIAGIDISQVKAIYCELWNKCPNQALALAHFAKNNNIPVLNNELSQLSIDSKVSQLALLADNNINIANTIMTSATNLKHIFAHRNIGIDYPFVLKSANGWGGNHNYLITDYNMLKDILNQNKDISFIVQEFIPNDYDYRLLIFNQQVKLILKRTRNEDNTHLNNTSKGAEGELVDLKTFPKEAMSAAIKASMLLKRGDFAGVDLLFDKYSGQYSLLEVNRTPQIEIGAYPEKKMAIMLDRIEELVACRRK